MNATAPLPKKVPLSTFTSLHERKIGTVSGRFLTEENVDSVKTAHNESTRIDTRLGTIRFGHTENVIGSPSKKDIELYKEGRQAVIPIRIVTYSKQGVPLPRTSSGKTTRAMCRNIHGGFYSE
jgi:hypothetical protein